jgi:hypothetical protein
VGPAGRGAGDSDPAPPVGRRRPAMREGSRDEWRATMLRWFDRVGRLTAPHVTKKNYILL